MIEFNSNLVKSILEIVVQFLTVLIRNMKVGE